MPDGRICPLFLTAGDPIKVVIGDVCASMSMAVGPAHGPFAWHVDVNANKLLDVLGDLHVDPGIDWCE